MIPPASDASGFLAKPRQSQDRRQQLLGAVEARQGILVAQLSCQWVHRQGVDSLERIISDLGDGDTSAWWRAQLVGSPGPAPLPVAAPLSFSEPVAVAPPPPAPIDESPIEETHIDEIPIEPTAPRAFTRLRHFVRDCLEEVSNTFQGQEPEPEISIAPSPATAQPIAELSALALSTPVRPPAIRPPAIRPPAISASVFPAGSSRPAPSPASPGLDRLRSWLPDDFADDQRRAS